jgi:hypothetical protein
MARSGEPDSERPDGPGQDGDPGHSRPGGRPRDSALDEDGTEIPERVVGVLWPGIAAGA